jgi:hypothetical protein
MSVSICFALPQQTVCFIGELLVPWNAHVCTDLGVESVLLAGQTQLDEKSATRHNSDNNAEPVPRGYSRPHAGHSCARELRLVA